VPFCFPLYLGRFQATGGFYRLFLCLNEKPLTFHEKRNRTAKEGEGLKVDCHVSGTFYILFIFHHVELHSALVYMSLLHEVLKWMHKRRVVGETSYM
jgi:hypothetical protein